MRNFPFSEFELSSDKKHWTIVNCGHGFSGERPPEVIATPSSTQRDGRFNEGVGTIQTARVRVSVCVS